MNLDLHFQTSTGSLVILSKSDAYALYQELQALFNIPINQTTSKMWAGSPIGQGGQASSTLHQNTLPEQWKKILESEPDTEVDDSTEEPPEPLRAEADEPDCDCFQCGPAEHNRI